jgi:hypothetical protein
MSMIRLAFLRMEAVVYQLNRGQRCQQVCQIASICNGHVPLQVSSAMSFDDVELTLKIHLGSSQPITCAIQCSI